MRKARTAELKNNLSRYLGYVRAGGEVLVLDRDTPIARVVPFVPDEAGLRAEDTGEARLAELERQGVITRGDAGAVRRWLKSHRPAAPPRGAGSVVRALIEMRDEERR